MLVDPACRNAVAVSPHSVSIYMIEWFIYAVTRKLRSHIQSRENVRDAEIQIIRCREEGKQGTGRTVLIQGQEESGGSWLDTENPVNEKNAASCKSENSKRIQLNKFKERSVS